MSLSLSSPAFAHREEIPRKYTADGPNLAPPLTIEGIPREAKSLALVVDDPDAPRAEPFVHWVLYDIPTNAELESGTQGINDFRRRGWAGPKPPSGRHHYHFKLYALDVVLGEKDPMTKDELLARLQGHVLEETELVGTYARAA